MQMLELLQYDPAETVLVVKQEFGPEVPAFFTNGATGESEPRTAYEICAQYLDVAAVPRRHFFELLSHFATDLREADRMLEFSTPTVDG